MLDDETLSRLFASDLARDVRAEFEDQRRYGVPVADATTAVVAQFRHALTHPTDGAVVILALATLQMQHRALHPTMRDAAVDLLGSGEAFQDVPGETLGARKERETLRERLLDALNNAETVEEADDA